MGFARLSFTSNDDMTVFDFGLNISLLKVFSGNPMIRFGLLIHISGLERKKSLPVKALRPWKGEENLY